MRGAIRNSILAGNTLDGSPADCIGRVESLGYNLIQSAAGCTLTGQPAGDMIGLDPMLGPLADNGGPTLSRLPLVGSPAIDAAGPTSTLNHPPPPTDTRSASAI